MSVRTIIQNILASRGNRRASDFQLLHVSDPDPQPNSSKVHYPNGNIEGGRGHDGVPEVGLQHHPHPQPPIEMKSLKTKIKKKEVKLELEPEECDFVPPPLQVYKPTSESLPESEQALDDSFSLSLQNVRLAIQEAISETIGEKNDNINNNMASEDDEEEEGSESAAVAVEGRKCGRFMDRCSMFSCPGLRKQHAPMMCAIIFGLCCLFGTMLFMGLGGMNGIVPHHHPHQNDEANKDSEDMNILRSQKWPLHDVQSRKLNISFDPMERAHEIWDFDKDDKSEDKVKEQEARKKPLDNSIDRGIHHRTVPVTPKLNGTAITEAVVAESYGVARGILSKNLHNNSLLLETLQWRGLASAVAIQEMMESMYRKKTIPRNLSMEGILPDDLCYQNNHSVNEVNDLSCSGPRPFRSINGSCNSVINGSWGSQYSPLRRIIEVKLTDSLQGKLVLSGSNESHNDTNNFPTPELVSETAHGGGDCREDLNVSALLPFWGMLILHDTVKVADSPVSCCDHHEKLFSHADAYLVSDKDATCSINSVQSFVHGPSNSFDELKRCASLQPFPAMYPTCNISEARSAFKLATSFIDASNIYGSSLQLSNKLRLMTEGKLRVKVGKKEKEGKLRVDKPGHTAKGFLLKALEMNESCFHGPPINAVVSHCFFSGDPDVNQVAILASLNTVLVRQHNHIAEWLLYYNRHWGDERLFQESRRILIAQIQHITYSEFLPLILGQEMMDIGGLTLEKEGYSERYDSAVDPTVSDAFAGAVGHFWLGMVNGKAESIWGEAKITQDTEYGINRLFYFPEYIFLKKGNMDALLKGFTRLSSNQLGVDIASELRSLNLSLTNATLDLVKITIQRGRELRVAPYVEWRKLCGFPEIKFLHELKDHWDPAAFQRISQVYKHVHHIDLFTGMLAEKPIHSGRVGPTLACLLTDQFSRFKRGDRFWFEGNVYADHFSPEQLQEIRKTTLSRIICDNTGHDISEIQKWPMLVPTTSSDYNPILLCADAKIPKLNFRLWKENPSQNKEMESGETSSEDDDDLYVMNSMSQEEQIKPLSIEPKSKPVVDDRKTERDHHLNENKNNSLLARYAAAELLKP